MLRRVKDGDPILGRRLRERRRALGLTQLEVATYAGINRSHLANIEAARKPAGRETLILLARRLDLSLDFLTAAPGESPRGAPPGA